mmetsp:Transcript_7951/g.7797  ORF Transcript_7951/g.7797 Transcript_7951/m.7797 type:complete len:125 (-) Transcript_7951:675-1049(-)
MTTTATATATATLIVWVKEKLIRSMLTTSYCLVQQILDRCAYLRLTRYFHLSMKCFERERERYCTVCFLPFFSLHFRPPKTSGKATDIIRAVCRAVSCHVHVANHDQHRSTKNLNNAMSFLFHL